MKEYYAIIRSTDHLAHYGVKGMKWGVRKALALGNERMLDRHFKKASKKLKKLQDLGLHSGKYAAKAAAYGTAAATTGAMTIGGTKAVGSMTSKAGKALKKLGNFNAKAEYLRSQKLGLKPRKASIVKQALYKSGEALDKAGQGLTEWGKGKIITGETKTLPIYKKAYAKYIPDSAQATITKTPSISNDTLFRIGTGVATVGLGAKAAHNIYRATHGRKYLDKADKFRQEMDNTFMGTKYEGQYIAPPKSKKKKRR